MNLNCLNRLVFEFGIDVEYLDLQKKECEHQKYENQNYNISLS